MTLYRLISEQRKAQKRVNALKYNIIPAYRKVIKQIAEALEEELSRAQVVERSELPAGVVSMNSRVHCREEGIGKDYHLTLVFPQDAGKEGTVSVLAPVGTALLGMTVGQHIDWPTPGGKVLKLTLLAVEYQPEAAGDVNL